MKKVLFLSLAVLWAALGCASAPSGPPVPQGTWSYELIDGHNNTWDQGTLTLQGQGTEGTWERKDSYGETDRGTWKSEGSQLSLSGPVQVKGTVAGSRWTGTWQVPEGDGGVFRAQKR